MKKAKVEACVPVKARKMGWWITTQLVDDVILVLNIYRNKILQSRHCINVLTGEYATLKGKIWFNTKIEHALGLEYNYPYYYYSDDEYYKRGNMSLEDDQYIRDVIKLPYKEAAVAIISEKETEYGREKRERAEMNRIERVNSVMSRIPAVPEDLREWIDQKELKGTDFALKDRKTHKWSCSACGREFSDVKSKDKPRDRELIKCPKCKKKIVILTRKQKIDVKTHIALVQPIDKDMSTVRYFEAVIQCIPGLRKQIDITEQIRMVLHKDDKNISNGKYCSIYYEQYNDPAYEDGIHIGIFDNKSNPANKSWHQCYLYNQGVREAFKDTVYEGWSNIFEYMAAVGIKANYNRLMYTKDDQNVINLVELLVKGRFRQLISEESESISYWSSAYGGALRLDGSSIEDVFNISDRQKINHIRDRNGGKRMLYWMQWSDRHHQKISDKALSWLIDNNLESEDMKWLMCRFTVEQSMNYIERQRKESYKRTTARMVISQYEDYMYMCEKLHKDTSDAIIYRPRELKRRHDEAVAAIERLNAQIKADEYSKKFGEAEKVLGTIKEKFEYSGEKFFIKVPEKIVDIVSEGNYLHHCAGATDRYFDRIKSHETYICFLRKIEEPDIPFYTIEIEPGGTIRQHRGMYDEEPELDIVKPFLREWQKEIRKRMSKEDHELAAVSKLKREENIAELKAKNNTRVLNGLMEDFMEAM